MKTQPGDLTVADVLKLKARHMLFPNPEYQRGAVWTASQKKKLLDSVLRGYPIPLIYFHHIRQEAGGLVSERFEIIDGQQRINALSDFYDGAFKLFDPVKDEAVARFPDFIRKQPCAWAGKSFQELSEDLKRTFSEMPLRIVKIETDEPNEARDLFVRLQAGMPLNSQEKRDAWPGQFTDFVLGLAGKPGVARYPGHDFFNELMKASKVQDRGRFRQLAAQIATLFMARRKGKGVCDINAQAIDDFYYENLGFDAGSVDAQRLVEIFDKLTALFRDGKRSKIIGHEAIHLVLLVDTLFDDYTPAWESRFASAFDKFRENLTRAKSTKDDHNPNEYWLRYGLLTRVNSDRGENIQRRHEFFAGKMYELLQPQKKDPQRLFGALEKELIYYRDGKLCNVCTGQVAWDQAEFHHVEQHSDGGKTTVDNGALVHSQCHPKGATATQSFEKQFRERLMSGRARVADYGIIDDGTEEEETGGEEISNN